MANITFSETPSSAIDPFNETKLQPTTQTKTITPLFSSVTRVITDLSTPRNFNISDIDSSLSERKNSLRGFLTGRRPAAGQQYPRGVYNK